MRAIVFVGVVLSGVCANQGQIVFLGDPDLAFRDTSPSQLYKTLLLVLLRIESLRKTFLKDLNL